MGGVTLLEITPHKTSPEISHFDPWPSKDLNNSIWNFLFLPLKISENQSTPKVALSFILHPALSGSDIPSEKLTCQHLFKKNWELCCKYYLKFWVQSYHFVFLSKYAFSLGEKHVESGGENMYKIEPIHQSASELQLWKSQTRSPARGVGVREPSCLITSAEFFGIFHPLATILLNPWLSKMFDV